MKRIIFSDLHLHTWPYGSKVNKWGFNTRLWAQYETLIEMVNYAIEHEVKYIYFCGDMFHTHANINAQALHVATEFVKLLGRHGIQFRAIPGNHDFASRDGTIHSLSWLPHHSLYGFWNDDDIEVVALPYTTDEEVLKKFLGDASEMRKGSMVLLHQGVAGVPLSSGFLMDEKLNPSMIPEQVIAFTGHYHFHKKVSDNLYVVGNLTPLNWNDVGERKGWLVIDDETREVEQVYQTSSPEFRLVGRDYRECGNAFVRVSEPVSSKEQETVRKEIIEAGAITVEFTSTGEEQETKQTSIRSPEEATLDHLVAAFDENLSPRRVKVGKQVREGSYVQP